MTFKKGDLVMVVRPMPCCGNTSGIGMVATINEIVSGDEWECNWCDKSMDDRRVALVNDDAILTCTLIKIDPPADQDQETKNKELEVVV